MATGCLAPYSQSVDPLCTQVQAFLDRHLPVRERRLLVAVSGGLDSMVLLHALRQLATRRPLRLIVAHFDHQLRGAASRLDARWVERSARRLGLACVAGAGDVAGHAKSQGISLEMAARDLRYRFLSAAAARYHASFIATAHHADDQVELFFLRLLRGSGGEGLAGMKPSAALPGDPERRLLRPFLAVRRAELEAWAKQKRLAHREDASNACLDILRNRIRHVVLPELKHAGGASVISNILRSLHLIETETEFVRQSAEGWLERLSAPGFEDLHPAIQRQVVRSQLARQGVLAPFEMVEAMRLSAGSVVTAPLGSRWVRRPEGRVQRVADPGVLDFNLEFQDVALGSVRGSIEFGGRRVAWRFRRKLTTPWPVKPTAGVEIFDAGSVGPHVRLRYWRPGDRFQPSGIHSPRKLQDLLVNQKIPAVVRRRLLVAESALDGQLFWVEGLRISELHKVRAGSERFLVWSWSDVEGQPDAS